MWWTSFITIVKDVFRSKPKQKVIEAPKYRVVYDLVHEPKVEPKVEEVD